VNRPELLDLFVSPLNDLGLTYMVTGAVAAIVYGEPRLTRDIDVVVALDPGDAQRLAEAFAPQQHGNCAPPSCSDVLRAGCMSVYTSVY